VFSLAGSLGDIAEIEQQLYAIVLLYSRNDRDVGQQEEEKQHLSRCRTIIFCMNPISHPVGARSKFMGRLSICFNVR
jgi:hypothetical protein